jgi:preprotein translocase subunit SecD
MAKQNDQANNDLDINALKAQIEAEIRAEYEKKAKEEAEKAAADKKALEEKIAAQEKNLEAQIVAQEKTLKQQLKDMPKVTIHIPEDPNNPDDVVPIGWNGIIYAVPRGQDFEVPVVIRDIWQESYKKTQEVQKRIRESTKKEIQILD